MHKEALEFVRGVISEKKLNRNDLDVLDIGSRCEMSPVSNRNLLNRVRSYTGIDSTEGKNVDIVCDALEFNPGEKYDVVLCTEVLEHAKHPEKIIKKISELLKDDGVYIITCASTGRPRHSSHSKTVNKEEHYKNITVENMISMCSGKLIIGKMFYRLPPGDLYVYGGKK